MKRSHLRRTASELMPSSGSTILTVGVGAEAAPSAPERLWPPRQGAPSTSGTTSPTSCARTTQCVSCQSTVLPFRFQRRADLFYSGSECLDLCTFPEDQLFIRKVVWRLTSSKGCFISETSSASWLRGILKNAVFSSHLCICRRSTTRRVTRSSNANSPVEVIIFFRW